MAETADKEMCGCGHPVDRHFAGGEGSGLGFHDRMCREPECRCVISGNPRLTGERYERPLFVGEQIGDLETLVLMLFETRAPATLTEHPLERKAAKILERIRRERR